MKTTSINLFAIITIPLSICLGILGLVSWYTIALIWLMQLRLDLKIK